MSTNRDKERRRLQDEFDEIQSGNSDFDISNHLARPEDLPDLGEIEIYDYDADMTVSSVQSKEVLETLVDLLLGDIPELKNHPYIKNKMNEDAMVYAEALFLAKMTRRNFLNQLRQVDNGDNSARMHEVINQTIGQIRENSKFLSGQRSELEKFYKNLRNDLGYTETKVIKETNDDKSDENEGTITDNRRLNDMIKNAIMGRDVDKGKK